MGASDREPEVSDEEILMVFVQHDESGLVARDVIEDLPIDLDVLNDRLDDLYERSLLKREDMPGGTGWSIAPGVEDDLSLSDADVETNVEAQAESGSDLETSLRRTDAGSQNSQMAEDESVGDANEPTTDLIEAIDLPGAPNQQESRREALRAAYRYLREGPSANNDDFSTEVFPDRPGGYDEPDDGWWQQVVRPGLVALPDVERRGDEWRFIDDAETERI